MGLKKNNPGCSCCGEEECANCIDSAAPTYMTLVVDGVLDDGCSNCEDMNGTWVIPAYSDCIWQRTESLDVCGQDVTIQLAALSAPRWEGGFSIFGVCSYSLYSDTTVASLDCMNADGTAEHLLDWDGDSTPDGCTSCDLAGATMEVYSGDTT